LAFQGRQRQRAREVFADVDILLTPTTPFGAPTVEAVRHDPAVAGNLMQFTRLFSVIGTPTLSIPLPGDSPAALQVSAAQGADAQVLAIGEGLQAWLKTSTS
jgi:Asp-tRNA(Asn)/Glu-tRNA(Gln) amidotransferase A subunit family amidase